MKDSHTHCPCNGVLLCSTCHADVHKNPFQARADGFIVSRSVAEPGGETVTAWYGTLLLGCNGIVTHFTGDVDAQAE